MANDNFFGDVPFGETSDGEIMRDEVTLDGTLDGLKDMSKTNLEEDESNIKDKSTLSINQSNLGIFFSDFVTFLKPLTAKLFKPLL